MASKTTRALVVLGAFVAGLVLCFGVVMLLTGQASSPIRPAAAAIGGPFHLTDENGRPVSDQDFRGKPFLVFFGYTHCPDVCPTTMFDVSEVLRRLGPDADKTAALFITVDPERDTPDKLKDYLGSFDPHLHGITGAPDAVAAVAKEYRVYYKKVPTDNGDYSMDHTAIVYLMDKNGHFVAPFSLRRTPEASADDLRRYL
jgi:protein SCO1/2